ncbi:MAG TPA: histidine kinase [Pseudomonas sp.]|uniref:HAMP domain-containing sensor histidine kinase n=1 Tax=Pseudomonas sp. TaxID=306 RepID=UPI002ED8795B
MSALWRINLWVIAFFALVTLSCTWLLLHQAVADVERELVAAEAVVEYLSETAQNNPASLQERLTGNLRHVRLVWLEAQQTPQPLTQSPVDDWLEHWLLPERADQSQVLSLSDGRRVQISLDPADEIDEVWDSLQQLLMLCGLALLLSLVTIRWAVLRGLSLLKDVLGALQQVSEGDLQVRLAVQGLPEARQLAGHFNRMTATLQRVQADNTRLTQALLAVQDQERTRLAQTLHDDLGQYLAGIRAQACLLRLVADDPALVRSTSSVLEQNCEQLQQGFRALIRDLYPVVLQHLPLPQAMALLVEQWRSSQHIACNLSIGHALPELSNTTKAHLYRLMQEALTNVVRHASATQVKVRLQRRGSRLWLLIRDNGQGASTPQRAGVGLHSMAERARCLNGELRIITRPGAGWALALNVPLEA